MRERRRCTGRQVPYSAFRELRRLHEPITDLRRAGEQQCADQSPNNQFYDHVTDWVDVEVGERIEIMGAAAEADDNFISLVRKDEQPTEVGSDQGEAFGIPPDWSRSPGHVILTGEARLIRGF